MNRPGLALGALLALTTCLPHTAPEAAERGRTTETFRWEGRLLEGQTVWVHGINGAIRVEPGTGDKVELVAEKSGRRDDPAEVRIEVRQDSDGLTFCAIYPGRRSVCDQGRYEMPVKNHDVTVDFRLRVPVHTRLVAGTVNGGVEARGLDGDIRATTVNGACTIATRGSGEASTVNGDVVARLGRIGDGDRLDFRTVNGRIELSLAGPLDATVRGSTVNGSIRSDFPVEVRGRWGPQSVRGTLGRGSAQVRLTTVNGGIELRRGRGETL
jgi:hypothetical protein